MPTAIIIRKSHMLIIEIRHNGDPYGNGFVGSQSETNGRDWYYLGNYGAQSRAWWRMHAQRLGAILRYAD